MLQKSSLDQDLYSQGKQATDAHHLCLEPPAATSTCLCSLLTSAQKHRLRGEKKWAKQSGLDGGNRALVPTVYNGGKERDGGITPGQDVEEAQSSHGGPCTHFSLHSLLWCWNLSWTAHSSPITSYFSHTPSASSHCSTSQCPLLGHAKALLASWFLLGPSRQILLPAGEGPGEVTRWHNSPFIRYSKFFCLVNAPPMVSF